MKRRRKAGTKMLSILMAAAMVMSMTSASFAVANPDAEGTPTQYNPNAHLTIGKTLNATQEGIWPDVTEFQFKLTADSYTPGPNALASYTNYTKADLPMPAAVTDVNGTAAANADGALESTITVKGFSNTATGTVQNHSSVTGDIPYTQTGVYTYKLQEITPDPAVPGVEYDGTLYYVNVYVTNVLHKDGTPVLGTDGKALVTVSQITAYKTTNGATDPTAADNGGNPPVANATTGKTTIVTPGSGDGDVRNITYPFVNNYTSTDLVITKKVTGTLADPKEDFTFNLLLKNSLGNNDGREYDYTIKSMGEDEIALNTDDTVVTDNVKISNGGTFTLKHNQYIVIKGLAAGEKFTVTEQAATDYTTSITPQSGTTAEAVVTNAKTAGEKTLSTDTGAINRQDYINNKNEVPPTGILLNVLPYVLIVGIAATGIVMVTRKKKYSDK